MGRPAKVTALTFPYYKALFEKVPQKEGEYLYQYAERLNVICEYEGYPLLSDDMITRIRKAETPEDYKTLASGKKFNSIRIPDKPEIPLHELRMSFDKLKTALEDVEEKLINAEYYESVYQAFGGENVEVS